MNRVDRLNVSDNYPIFEYFGRNDRQRDLYKSNVRVIKDSESLPGLTLSPVLNIMNSRS